MEAMEAETFECSAQASLDEDDGCSTVDFNYGGWATHWMNGCYMDLKMRSNPLFHAEATHALHQHFHLAYNAGFQNDVPEHDSVSSHDQIVTRHGSLQSSQGESYGLSGVVVFDKSMFSQLGGRSFTEQYGHLVNEFNSGITSFMDEPFC